MNFQKLRGFLVPLPPLHEQKAIATFLDEKTAQIDRAVAQNERLMDLLRERQQIVVQNAITRGLDPDAEMKDSGVDWIGEVPKHWEVVKISLIGRVFSGLTPNRSNQLFWNGNIPWVKTGEVKNNIINNAQETVTELAIKRTGLKIAPVGTLLIAMYGQGETRGRVAVLGIESAFNQACCAIVFDEVIRNQYAFFYFRAGYKHFRNLGNETSQMNMSTSLIAKLKIPLPPLSEQSAIVAHIEAQATKTEKAISLLEQQNERLKEYKAVLIDRAVTGKINITDHVSPISE